MLLTAASSRDSDRDARLLGHADSVYTMAHALTLDAVQASALVEAVYRRAAAEQPPETSSERAWLLRLLREEAREARVPIEGGSAGISSGDFRRKLAAKAVQRVMPAAFASLTPEEREMLMLIHVERFSEDEAESVTGMPSEEMRELLAEGETELRAAVERNLLPGETALIRHLSDEWLRESLNNMVTSDLPALPPTVRPELPTTRAEPAEPRRPYPQKRPRAPGRSAAVLRRLGIAALVIFFAGLFAYGAARLLDRPAETNAIVLAADAAADVRLDLQTDDPAAIEQYLIEELDWRLVVPEIENTTLLGVDIREIISGVRVPVLYYDDTLDNQHIAVLVFTYVLIDQNEGRLQFERETLAQIQREGHYDLHDIGRRQVLIWRHRNQIFVAVTRGGAEALQDRIYPPS